MYTSPSVSFEDSQGVTHSNVSAAAGVVTGQAEVAEGYIWDEPLPEGWQLDSSDSTVVRYSGTYVEEPCAPVVPAMPSVVEAVCAAGEVSSPQVSTIDTERMTYTQEGDVIGGGTVMITATLEPGYSWDEAMPDGWVVDPESVDSASFVVEFAEVNCEPVLPELPVVPAAVCEDGEVVQRAVELPVTPGVSYAAEGEVGAGGEVTISATLADGYSWDAPMPEGWTETSSGTAVYVTAYENPECETPADPDAPVDPDVPADPDTPTDPDVPADPDTPADPDASAKTDDPRAQADPVKELPATGTGFDSGKGGAMVALTTVMMFAAAAIRMTVLKRS